MGRAVVGGARALGLATVLAGPALFFSASAGASQPATSVSVGGVNNIYGAGLRSPPDPGGGGAGLLPVKVPIPSGATWMSVTDVSGTVSYTTGASNGPDGAVGVSGNISATGDLSGLIDSTSWFYLTGVYLDGPQLVAPIATTTTTLPTTTTTNPTSPPATLNFTGDHSFSTLSPELDQVFFIGDGLTSTGTGQVQVFRVPTHATDLYLGFVDAYGFQGSPGYYGDNSGGLSLTVNFSGGADAAPIATSLGTPIQIFHSMGHNIVNAGITVAAILLITFPSTIFNQTFSANYGEIVLIVAGLRRRLRRTFGLKDKRVGSGPEPGSVAVASAAAATAATERVASAGARTDAADTPGRSSRPWFCGVLLAGAVLGGLLNPTFGLNERTLADIGATLVAFALATLIGFLIAKAFRRHHHYPARTYLHALPLGLAIAALCVLVSRLTNFEPGYLYGVVVSIAFAETLEERHNAHLTAISTLSMLGVGLLAWFLWIPVNHVAIEHGHNLFVAIVDDALASIFVGGLVGTVIGLLPLEFMPGGTLAKWRKDVWAAVFFIALFLLVEVELRPAAGPTHPGGAPIVTVVVLFAIFGGGTFFMRHFFVKRKVNKNDHAASDPSMATPEVGAPKQNG